MAAGNIVSITTPEGTQVPCKQVTGRIEKIDLEQGRDFRMGKHLDGMSTEYSVTLRLDSEYRGHYGIVAPFTFSGNEEKRQELEALNLAQGEHVAVYLNRLSILMKVERIAS